MIVMPAMPAAQEQVWHALFQVADQLPAGWALVGGQMVHLLCAERGVTPLRVTTDADAVLDIRSHRDMLERFTGLLLDLGYTSAGPSAEGHEHRWVNGPAMIDVLVPTNLGPRAQATTGATGSTTVATRGAQQALDRAELVAVQVGHTSGQVRRPNLVGALIIKAAATSVPSGDAERHKTDFTLLATMIRPSDDLSSLTTRDRQHLRHAMDAVARSTAAHQVAGWQTALRRLELALTPTT